MKKTFHYALLLLIAFSSFSFVVRPTKSVSRSLVFPVSGKRSSIESFWGASRDGGRRRHEGIDIFARRGTPVVAISDGQIVSKGITPIGGKVLWLQSATTGLTAYYAHLDQFNVRNGQRVRKGQVLGTVGKTGNARTTPPHLHFGMYTERGAVNPLPYVKHSKKITVKSTVKKSSVKKKSTTKSKAKRSAGRSRRK